MNQEIELKLRLSQANARCLPALPPLAGVAARKRRLFNTYYDTPDLALQQRGIALRLRRQDWDWLMTVKSGEPAAGGLARRSEWEAPTEAGCFDFDIVGDDELRDFLNARRAELVPIFTTDFTRLAWTLQRGDTQVELALDRGHIDATRRDGKAVRQPICELEIELLAGASANTLFAIAIELASDIHLHPEAASKAERGYALAAAAPSRPEKAAASPLVAAMSPVEAFRAVALSCLLHLQRNEAGACAGDNAEYVHQARVAIRRLRSAMRLFAPVLPVTFVSIYSPRWRDIATGLGGARDWDVFLDETLAPLEEAFPGDRDLAEVRAGGEALQAAAQKSAGVALRGVDYSQLLLAFTAALHHLPAAPVGGGAERKLRGFARRRLQKRFHQIEALARDHGRMNATRRHEMRIAFKKLRYAIEFFAPLLPARRLRAYQPTLAGIQDLLGHLNDLATAATLIERLHADGEQSLTRGWIAGRTDLLLAALTPALRAFIHARRPWAR